MSEDNIKQALAAPYGVKVFQCLIEENLSAMEIRRKANIDYDSVAAVLDRLESVRAVEYVEEKWKATDIGKKVFKKFYL